MLKTRLRLRRAGHRIRGKLLRLTDRWPYMKKYTSLETQRMALALLRRQHDIELETERERVEMVLGQFVGMRVMRHERGYQFTINMDPEPFAHFGHMDTRFWEYVAERMSHEIRRHLATLDFSRVKEMHHPDAYQFDRLRTGVFHKDTRFP